MRQEICIDKLRICCCSDRIEMGKACAETAAKLIRELQEKQEQVNIIFASSPSQLEMLDALREEPVDWRRVNAFHMDEYVGLPACAKQSFANYLNVNFFSKLEFGQVFFMNGIAEDIDAECRRYGELLQRYPTDIAFVGIGENGHLAFNDPYIADFFDPVLMKENCSLDPVCRQQQINDGWFQSFDEVPKSAITITIYGLLRARYVFATVPGASKKHIVRQCLEEPVTPDVPGSGIRLHRNAQLFIDQDSAQLLTCLHGMKR